MIRRYSRGLFQQDRPKADIERTEIPQCGSLAAAPKGSWRPLGVSTIKSEPGNRYLTSQPSAPDIPRRMRIGRTVLAFWVAMSLAMLPLAGTFAAPSEEPMVSDVVESSAHEH